MLGASFQFFTGKLPWQLLTALDGSSRSAAPCHPTTEKNTGGKLLFWNDPISTVFAIRLEAIAIRLEGCFGVFCSPVSGHPPPKDLGISPEDSLGRPTLEVGPW